MPNFAAPPSGIPGAPFSAMPGPPSTARVPTPPPPTGGPPRPGRSMPPPSRAASPFVPPPPPPIRPFEGAPFAPAPPSAPVSEPSQPLPIAPPAASPSQPVAASPSQPAPAPSQSAPAPEEEEFAPLLAMPIITINTDPDPSDEPPAAAAPESQAPRGIDTAVDPGWTPAPVSAAFGGALSSIPMPVVTPGIPAVPSVEALPSADIEELAEDDISPESDQPRPPLRTSPGTSMPPKPPPPPPGSTPQPPRVEMPSEVDVELNDDDDTSPISLRLEEATAKPPPPPPAAMVSTPPAAVPPPPPAAALAAPPPPPAAAAQSKPAESRPRPSADNKKRGRPWWEEMFDDDFLRSLKQPTARQLEGEVSFIDDRLGLQKGALILDLACGNGRHAIGLARRGYKVVGFDLSLAMMARAQEEAETAQQKINFLHGDMREMTFENMFDGVTCWGMSFGYFEEEKNLAVLQRMHRALRPGGVLLLDLNNRDYIAPRQPNMVWFEGEGCICMDETNIDFITSRLKVKRTVMLEDGRTRELDFSIRLYGLNELGKLLHDAGFKVLEVSGQVATPGVFFGSDSPRCIVLAERS